MKKMKKGWGTFKLAFAVVVVGLAFSGSAAKAVGPPTVTTGNISVSGATGNGGAFISNNAQTGNHDAMRVEWDNSAIDSGTIGDGNAGITNATVDFSQFEGDSAVQAFDDGGTGNDDYDSCDTNAGDGIWTACYSIHSGTLDGATGKNVSVTATNAIGSTTVEDDTNATVDNVAPADDSTVDTYGTDATNFSFGGTTSANRKVYYEIWDDNGLYASDYVGQAASGSGDYTFSGINISAAVDGVLQFYVWVEDPAGNYSPSWSEIIRLTKTSNVIGLDKSSLTSAINDEYSDGSGRTTYELTQSGYTSGSWTTYVDAIAAAKVTEGDGAATPTEVSDAITTIDNARDDLVLSGVPIAVSSITVYSDEDAISMINGATLEMGADVFPEDASDSDVVWSVATLASGTATIDSDGLLTATGAGTVTVTATAHDESAVVGTKIITITEVTVSSITVKTPPTKTVYTAGENLNLAGLVVTLTKSDTTTQDVSFADFAANSITTSKTNGAVLATGDTTVVITANGHTTSQSITVNIPPVAATPAASPAGGTYTSNQSVSLSTTTSGATIHYTTDGSTPASSSTTYSSAISITGATTLKAIAVNAGMTDSAVMSEAYTINIPQAATPAASPAGGTYTSAQSVSLSTSTGGATIYYTTEGSTPTSSSATYSSPISITGATTLKAIAIKSGMTDSAVMSESYNVQVTTNMSTLTFNSSKKAKTNITFTFKDLSLTNKKYVKVSLNGRKTTVVRVSRSGNDSLVTVTLKYGRWPAGNYTLKMSYKNQIKVAYLKKGKTKYRKGWESGSVTSENILSIN